MGHNETLQNHVLEEHLNVGKCSYFVIYISKDLNTIKTTTSFIIITVVLFLFINGRVPATVKVRYKFRKAG